MRLQALMYDFVFYGKFCLFSFPVYDSSFLWTYQTKALYRQALSGMFVLCRDYCSSGNKLAWECPILALLACFGFLFHPRCYHFPWVGDGLRREPTVVADSLRREPTLVADREYTLVADSLRNMGDMRIPFRGTKSGRSAQFHRQLWPAIFAIWITCKPLEMRMR